MKPQEMLPLLLILVSGMYILRELWILVLSMICVLKTMLGSSAALIIPQKTFGLSPEILFNVTHENKVLVMSTILHSLYFFISPNPRSSQLYSLEPSPMLALLCPPIESGSFLQGDSCNLSDTSIIDSFHLSNYSFYTSVSKTF